VDTDDYRVLSNNTSRILDVDRVRKRYGGREGMERSEEG